MLAKLIDIWLGVLVFFNTFLALLIYYKNPKSRANIFYSLAVLSSALWTAGTLLFRIADGLFLHIISDILWAATVPIVYFFLYFSLNFPNKIKLKKRIHILIFLPAFFVLLYLILYVGLYTEIKYINGYRAFVYNPLTFFPYSLYIVSYFLASFIILLKKYFRYEGLVRTQLYFVISGTLFSSAAGVVFGLIFTYFGNFQYYWMSSGFTFIMTGFIAYAIVRHRLMDIRFVLRKYSVYFTALLSIIVPIILIKYFFANYLSIRFVWADYLFIIIAVAAFPVLKDKYFYFANKYFFSSLYDARLVIAKISDKLRSTLLIDNIYRYIAESLADALHIKTIGIFLFNEKHNTFDVKYSYGRNAGRLESFAGSQDFYNEYIRKNKVALTEKIRKDSYVKHKKTIDLLDMNGAELVIPLLVKDKIIGLVTLSDKESHEIYNDEDFQLLEIISAQAAIAIDNALNYEEVKNFSKKLQHEVEVATEGLIRANSKLRQLDQAKSEFVSIASHQLRTPLTIIKGYISMIIEGNYGKISSPVRESLDKVYSSNERLIHLVENLLNISRIESGRLEINKVPTQLTDIIASVVDELRVRAREKGLRLIYDEPTEALPDALIDVEKIRQVAMNLIDNAIKYTKKGKITVKIVREKHNLVCQITDTGMGINKNDLLDLFEKFSRGSGTSLVHTEGTGLGLYVAKQMITAHGGEIKGKSRGEGKGSVFTFTLPLL